MGWLQDNSVFVASATLCMVMYLLSQTVYVEIHVYPRHHHVSNQPPDPVIPSTPHTAVEVSSTASRHPLNPFEDPPSNLPSLLSGPRSSGRKESLAYSELVRKRIEDDSPRGRMTGGMDREARKPPIRGGGLPANPQQQEALQQMVERTNKRIPRNSIRNDNRYHPLSEDSTDYESFQERRQRIRNAFDRRRRRAGLPSSGREGFTRNRDWNGTIGNFTSAAMFTRYSPGFEMEEIHVPSTPTQIEDTNPMLVYLTAWKAYTSQQPGTCDQRKKRFLYVWRYAQCSESPSHHLCRCISEILNMPLPDPINGSDLLVFIHVPKVHACLLINCRTHLSVTCDGFLVFRLVGHPTIQLCAQHLSQLGLYGSRALEFTHPPSPPIIFAGTQVQGISRTHLRRSTRKGVGPGVDPHTAITQNWMRVSNSITWAQSLLASQYLR